MLEIYYPIIDLSDCPNNKIIKKKWKNVDTHSNIGYEIWNYDKNYFSYSN